MWEQRQKSLDFLWIEFSGGTGAGADVELADLRLAHEIVCILEVDAAAGQNDWALAGREIAQEYATIPRGFRTAGRQHARNCRFTRKHIVCRTEVGGFIESTMKGHTLLCRIRDFAHTLQIRRAVVIERTKDDRCDTERADGRCILDMLRVRACVIRKAAIVTAYDGMNRNTDRAHNGFNGP
jgi:hypothetical protein